MCEIQDLINNIDEFLPKDKFMLQDVADGILSDCRKIRKASPYSKIIEDNTKRKVFELIKKMY